MACRVQDKPINDVLELLVAAVRVKCQSKPICVTYVSGIICYLCPRNGPLQLTARFTF